MNFSKNQYQMNMIRWQANIDKTDEFWIQKKFLRVNLSKPTSLQNKLSFPLLDYAFSPMKLQTRFLFLDDLFHFSDKFLFPNDSSQISFSALLVAFEGKSDVMIYWRRAVFLLRRVLYQIKLRWRKECGV